MKLILIGQIRLFRRGLLLFLAIEIGALTIKSQKVFSFQRLIRIKVFRLEEVVNAEMYACLSGRKTVYQALYDASRRVEREVLVER